MKRRLARQFYIQPTLTVAPSLLGKYLIRQIGEKKLVGKIIEVEAYIGPQDKASHAYQGKRTLRNEAEFLIGGHIYIYLVYGRHWQLNISTFRQDKPECVLIRSIEPVIPELAQSSSAYQQIKKQTNGPGKVCRYLQLDKSFYGEDLVTSSRIWLEDWQEEIKPASIIKTARIGIDYAGYYWSRRKWRFVLSSDLNKNTTISRK